jgi:hypothetical protein
MIHTGQIVSLLTLSVAWPAKQHPKPLKRDAVL